MLNNQTAIYLTYFSVGSWMLQATFHSNKAAHNLLNELKYFFTYLLNKLILISPFACFPIANRYTTYQS